MSAADVRGLISSSFEFRKVTEELYTGVYHKPLNKSCGDCWLDAYILLMKGNPEKLKAMAEKLFDLRAGAVLVDPQGDPKKTITRLNMTDKLALYHLRTHPDCIKLFSVFPPDWEEMATASGVKDEIENKPAPQKAAEGAENAQKPTKGSRGGNTSRGGRRATTGEKKQS